VAKATWNGSVLAEGDDVILVEGNCYFSRDHIRWDYFKPASTTTFCGWKGTANYYDIEVDGHINPGAAWYYADPMPAAEEVRNRIAFWKGVKVEAEPGVRQGPAPPPARGV
jgi:uncharacterized protein (DUF427 family)